MKKFLFRTVVIIILAIVSCFLLSFFVDYGLSHVRYDHEYAKINKLMDNRTSEDVVILGSSRAEEHFSPNLIHKTTGLNCYNYGIAGAHFSLQEPFSNYYFLKNHKKPKVIIQEVGFTSFDVPRHIIEKNRFLAYLSEPSIYNSLIKIDSSLWKDRWIPMVKYFGNDFPILVGLSYYAGFNTFLKDSLCTNGQVVYDRVWNTDASKHINNNFVNTKTEDFINGIRFLSHLQRQCKNNGIKLIFVNSPTYHLYSDRYNDLHRIHTAISSLCDSSNVIYFNYEDLEMCRDTANFFDVLHMNKRGVEKFNELFISDLKLFLDSHKDNLHAK